jgi:hypothetical protein
VLVALEVALHRFVSTLQWIRSRSSPEQRHIISGVSECSQTPYCQIILSIRSRSVPWRRTYCQTYGWRRYLSLRPRPTIRHLNLLLIDLCVYGKTYVERQNWTVERSAYDENSGVMVLHLVGSPDSYIRCP